MRCQSAQARGTGTPLVVAEAGATARDGGGGVDGDDGGDSVNGNGTQ